MRCPQQVRTPDCRHPAASFFGRDVSPERRLPALPPPRRAASRSRLWSGSCNLGWTRYQLEFGVIMPPMPPLEGGTHRRCLD